MARPFRWSSESKAARGEEEPRTRRATTTDPTVVARGRSVYAAQIRARGDLCCFGRQAVAAPRLRCSITLLPCPHETGGEVIPRPANERVRVREQQIAHDATLFVNTLGGEVLDGQPFRC